MRAVAPSTTATATRPASSSSDAPPLRNESSRSAPLSRGRDRRGQRSRPARRRRRRPAPRAGGPGAAHWARRGRRRAHRGHPVARHVEPAPQGRGEPGRPRGGGQHGRAARAGGGDLAQGVGREQPGIVEHHQRGSPAIPRARLRRRQPSASRRRRAPAADQAEPGAPERVLGQPAAPVAAPQGPDGAHGLDHRAGRSRSPRPAVRSPPGRATPRRREVRPARGPGPQPGPAPAGRATGWSCPSPPARAAAAPGRAPAAASHPARPASGAALITHLEGLGRDHGRRLAGHRPGGGHPERMTSSTSSRFRSMSSSETSDSRFRRRSGSVLEGRTLKCQSRYSTDNPSISIWRPSA